jgi:hypothetical protein
VLAPTCLVNWRFAQLASTRDALVLVVATWAVVGIAIVACVEIQTGLAGKMAAMGGMAFARLDIIKVALAIFIKCKI